MMQPIEFRELSLNAIFSYRCHKWKKVSELEAVEGRMDSYSPHKIAFAPSTVVYTDKAKIKEIKNV